MTKEDKALKALLEFKLMLVAKLASGNFALHPQDMLQEVNKIIKELE